MEIQSKSNWQSFDYIAVNFSVAITKLHKQRTIKQSLDILRSLKTLTFVIYPK